VADFGFRTAPTTVGSIVAQSDSDGIGCRFVVDDVVNTETISHEANAIARCILRAA
jgi:Mycobacterium membrane protein